MLVVYLVCLIVGGVFVGLSALGAFGDDADVDAGADADAHIDADADVDVDADADFHVEADVDVDVDADADFHADADAALHVEADAGVEGPHEASLADASHGADRPRRRRLWLPFLSFRFWTFGAAFFGLAGTLLTALTGAGEPGTALASLATGLGVGTLSAALIRWLRNPVSAAISVRDYAGRMGVVQLPLEPGGTTRIRIQLGPREREMLARTDRPLALPKGAQVVVIGIDEDGRALIEPEEALFLEES